MIFLSERVKKMNNIVLYDEAVELINEAGFLFLSKNKYDYLSLENVTNEHVWYNGSKDDPWVWKDKIAYEKKAAYAKLFSKKPMFVSWEWYPVFLAYLRKGWDKEDFYESGHLSNFAKEIYDMLEVEKVLPTHEIKKYFKAEKEKTIFDNALTELQTKMLVTISGSSQKINNNGEPYGWFVSNFALVDQWIDLEILKKAEAIKFEDAKEAIYSQIRKTNGELNDKQIDRLIGVKLEWSL